MSDLNTTDLGNARRFAERHGQETRYCAKRKQWFIWDRRRWKGDDGTQIERRAKETVRSIYEEAAAETDDTRRKELADWARESEAAHHIKNMIFLARSESVVALDSTDLNSDPWLLNCLNGTVDLKTGNLREHRREDLITNLAPVEYAPEASHPMWDSFIDWITSGNQEFANFLRRAVGYSLTADVSEEKLFFVHGPGAAAKSTFLEALKATLGDYAKTADFEAFLKRTNVGGPRNDIARLAGARFVVSIEVDEGKQLAEGLVKMVTGGDTVTARHLYKESFEFVPSFKLWLAANHAPKVRDDDDAMWRRILRIPFDRVVPKEQRDPNVKATLKNPALAGPAILAWAVRGCLEWQRNRLGVPPLIEAATQEYRDGMDPLADFMDDCCTIDPASWTGTTDLWKAYETWAKENSESHPLTRPAFVNRMEKRGLQRDRIGKNRDRVWLGINLVSRGETLRLDDGGQADTGGQVAA